MIRSVTKVLGTRRNDHERSSDATDAADAREPLLSASQGSPPASPQARTTSTYQRLADDVEQAVSADAITLTRSDKRRRSHADLLPHLMLRGGAAPEEGQRAASTKGRQSVPAPPEESIHRIAQLSEHDVTANCRALLEPYLNDSQWPQAERILRKIEMDRREAFAGAMAQLLACCRSDARIYALRKYAKRNLTSHPIFIGQSTRIAQHYAPLSEPELRKLCRHFRHLESHRERESTIEGFAALGPGGHRFMLITNSDRNRVLAALCHSELRGIRAQVGQDIGKDLQRISAAKDITYGFLVASMIDASREQIRREKIHA